ncbi:serine/threonine-protein kinase [Actinomadura sp. DC4]|uniref:serine/threonine-protein kinase n=1 Tax=Actinomadura sp. DC4 TaxID=3055069 RepID=UPI0025B03287|nr:serine/threonine-protein kinase [Actinomadura sp. DC4]MDN3359990.1 serine/threonine-protein kinase [Actinomadura sp. DC4]
MPSAVGRYRIDRVLGSGAFASVWLAHDEVLDAKVAVKVLAGGLIDDLDVRNRFLEEAKILRRADSERLVRVHDIGELADGRPYFVMSYADLGTLSERMRTRDLPVGEALRLAAEVAHGVEVINRLGIIHRDLKPSNVLFQSTTDGGERLLIADLGLAKALAHASGAFTLPVGTPGYMSPEQARFGGGLDVRADVYGLGALTYHLVTGRPPSTAPVLVPPSSVRPDLPPAVDEIVMRALETDRERRWPSAEAFGAALGVPLRSVSHGVSPDQTVADRGTGDATVGDPTVSGRAPVPPDDTTSDRPSRRSTRTSDPSGSGSQPGRHRMSPAYEPTEQRPLPGTGPSADETRVDLPVVGAPEEAAEVRAGQTGRSRVLAALGLVAVLVVGAGGAYAIAKMTGAGSSDKPEDGLVSVTDTTGRLTLRVPPTWRLQTQRNRWPVTVSDGASAPALRATPDYAQFVRDDTPVPGVFAGLTHDLTVTLPPPTLGSHTGKCTAGAQRPYRHGSLSGRITPWTCGGSITINEVGLRDASGKFAMWVRVKLTGPPDITQKILDSITAKG